MCLLGSQELGEACSGGSEFPAGLHVEVPYTAPGYRIPAEDAHTDMESCDVLEPFTPVFHSYYPSRSPPPNMLVSNHPYYYNPVLPRGGATGICVKGPLAHR
jgi:hypothetical protein